MVLAGRVDLLLSIFVAWSVFAFFLGKKIVEEGSNGVFLPAFHQSFLGLGKRRV